VSQDNCRKVAAGFNQSKKDSPIAKWQRDAQRVITANSAGKGFTKT
jgi:hypothetical protein